MWLKRLSYVSDTFVRAFTSVKELSIPFVTVFSTTYTEGYKSKFRTTNVYSCPCDLKPLLSKLPFVLRPPIID